MLISVGFSPSRRAHERHPFASVHIEADATKRARVPYRLIKFSMTTCFAAIRGGAATRVLTLHPEKPMPGGCSQPPQRKR